MTISLQRSIYNIRRLREVLAVLAKYGFGYIVDRLPVDNLIGRSFRRMRTGKAKITGESVPVRARRLLEELGPTFIKLGQILSTRPDLIPIDFCREFEKLQDRAPVFEVTKVEKSIEENLGKPVSALFEHFERKPRAAASLAQVHDAALMDGTSVVVKVQRPDIEKVILADIDIMLELAKLAVRYVEESRPYDPVGLVNEFKCAILQEIDFQREARNIERFSRQFADDPKVCFPKVYERLSTKRILTIERIEGIKVSDVEEIESAGLDRQVIARVTANAFLKQVFEYGFFHADPHPGNILALSDNRISFIDCGMVGRIHAARRDQLAQLFVALLDRDLERITQICFRIGVADEKTDTIKFELDIEDFLDQYLGRALHDIRMGRFLMNLIDIIADNKITLPSSFYLLSRAMLIMEAVVERLYPEFDMVSVVKPFARRLLLGRYNPKRVVRELRRFGEMLYSFGISLPKDLSEVFGKIKEGRLRIEFEHKGLEHLILEMDRVSNRIAFSLIIAALIVGSSIIMQTNKGPLLLDFPIFGIVGYVIAGIMGLWLVIAILRSGRLK